MEHIALPESSVHKALMRSVLVHVLNKQPAINEIYRVLKPDGGAKNPAFTNMGADIDRYFATLDYPSQIKAQVFGGKEYSKEDLTRIWNEANEDIANRDINEIFALNPKVEQIIIHKAMKAEEIPAELIMLSHEYNIPIIIMPEAGK